jgi:exodeoxyribonuclease VII large subunit
MEEFNSREKFISLSDIGKKIEGTINGSFGNMKFWIVAEVAGLNVRKGHCYLTLIEKETNKPQIKAEIKGIIWSDIFTGLNYKFKNVTGSDIKEDTSILFSATVNYSAKFGMSLVIDDIEPQYTVGLLLQEREKTVAKLKQMGYYAMNKSRHFPLVPQNIAVISATDSRGFEDFKNKLINNPNKYKFNLTLFSSLLQGDKAAEDIRQKLIDIYNEKGKYDIVVIVRGGGGPVNLTAFNNFRLAEAVARFPIPVITGIGHTANISVVDEVAFSNRATPTDVADFILLKVFTFEQTLVGLFKNIVKKYELMSANTAGKLELSKSNLIAYVKHFQNISQFKIIDLFRELSGSLNKIINSQFSIINSQFIKLSLQTNRRIEFESKTIKNISEKVELLDPKNTLSEII